jgi:hypothetical protein
MRSERLNLLAVSLLAFIGFMAPGSSFAGVVTFPFVFGSPQTTNFQAPAIGVPGTPGVVTITLNPNGQVTNAGRLVNISFTGPNAPDFAIVPGGTCVPGTTILTPITPTTGQSCTVNIRYTPSGNATESGFLQVTCQASAIVGGFSVVCNAAGATGAIAALVGAIGSLVQVPTLDPWMTTALALLMLTLGTFAAMRRPPSRNGQRGGSR